MVKGSIAQIESMGLVDGPGIRTVVFLNGCKLRCMFCHNPEMFKLGELNYTPGELFNKILRNKPYFKNNGGVTFSGGEPLLQYDFLVETCKLLKKENINIALDTAGVGNGNYDEILKLVDLVIFDIKAIDDNSYKEITANNINESLKFLKRCQELNKKMWLRQVIIPGINDNEEYINRLVEFIKPLKNIEKIELLPYHTMAKEKYNKLNLPYKLKNTIDMNIDRCKELEKLIREKTHIY
ncbi:MAG: pyruvate formate lyase-activating protein [Bacilli bacterium]|nr:pyruvate formate lyase-activating protein [Bacilli bacterium]